MSVQDHIAKLKIELSGKSDDELIVIKQLGVKPLPLELVKKIVEFRVTENLKKKAKSEKR